MGHTFGTCFFSVSIPKKPKVLLIFYEEGSKITGFMYIIEHATQERNTREVTDR